MVQPVAILLINWNNEPDTAECLDSCLKLDYANFRIIVVDNGSVDDSGTRLKKRFPDVEVIKTGSNLGFSGGNNVGIRHALSLGAEYIWLLNNDTVVDSAALSTLVGMAENDRTIGMVGSKIHYHDAPSKIWYAGAWLDKRYPYRSSHRGLNEEDRGQYDLAGETGYVSGCSLLATKRMIEKVGLLDDDLFLYYEDIDWNARAVKKGWKAVYCPSSLVFHKVSISIGGMDSPRMKYYLARNLLYFIRHNFPETFLQAVLFDLYENVLVAVKKRNFRAAGYAIRGIFDYACSKRGAFEITPIPRRNGQ